MYWERTRSLHGHFYRLFARPGGPALKSTKNPFRALWWRLRWPNIDQQPHEWPGGPGRGLHRTTAPRRRPFDNLRPK